MDTLRTLYRNEGESANIANVANVVYGAYTVCKELAGIVIPDSNKPFMTTLHPNPRGLSRLQLQVLDILRREADRKLQQGVPDCWIFVPIRGTGVSEWKNTTPMGTVFSLVGRGLVEFCRDRGAARILPAGRAALDAVAHRIAAVVRREPARVAPPAPCTPHDPRTLRAALDARVVLDPGWVGSEAYWTALAAAFDQPVAAVRLPPEALHAAATARLRALQVLDALAPTDDALDDDDAELRELLTGPDWPTPLVALLFPDSLRAARRVLRDPHAPTAPSETK